MISLIICSRSESEFYRFSQNVEQTIGCEHQLIRIDNSLNEYSISKAYNEGAKSSEYSNLVFVHEDVTFLTNAWGINLLEALKKPDIGLVGLAGGTIKTKATGPAWWSPTPDGLRMNLVQRKVSGEKEHLFENPLNEQYSEVVALDGVFLACRKEVWEKYPFDEQTIKGFHFYDLDLSLAVRQSYKNLVVYDILLEHFSEGKNDLVWAEQADFVMKKWRPSLPQVSVKLSKADLKRSEQETEDFYLHRLFENKAGKSLIRKYVARRILNRPLDILANLYFIKRMYSSKIG